MRIVLAALTLFVSIPWISALLGFYLPEGLFIMERPGIENGTTISAVHLGEHHGFMGTLLVWTALLLSRPAAVTGGRLGTIAWVYLSVAFAYGAVNMTQDAWNEQLWKRDLVDRKIPSALLPALEPIWLVTLGLACVVAFLLRRERRDRSCRGLSGEVRPRRPALRRRAPGSRRRRWGRRGWWCRRVGGALRRRGGGGA